MDNEVITIHPRVRYKEKVWTVETIFFSANPRIRIGRVDQTGQYEWELVFENELTKA